MCFVPTGSTVIPQQRCTFGVFAHIGWWAGAVQIEFRRQRVQIVVEGLEGIWKVRAGFRTYWMSPVPEGCRGSWKLPEISGI